MYGRGGGGWQASWTTQAHLSATQQPGDHRCIPAPFSSQGDRRGGQRFGGGGSSGGDRGSGRQGPAASKQTDWREAVRADRVPAERPRWTLTCYAHEREGANDITGDISPEEVRWANLQALAAGAQGHQLAAEFKAAERARVTCFQTLQRANMPPSKGGPPIPLPVEGIKGVTEPLSGGQPFGGAAPGGGFQQPAASPFGQPAIAAAAAVVSPFGQPAAASPFGQPAASPLGQPAAGAAFGQQAALPFGQPAAASPFGHPAASTAGQPAASPFGQPAFGQAVTPALGAQQPAGFGAPGPTGGFAGGFGGGFGAAPATKPVFGQPQPQQPFGGAPAASTSPFGALFGAPSPFGAAAAPSQAQPPSAGGFPQAAPQAAQPQQAQQQPADQTMNGQGQTGDVNDAAWRAPAFEKGKIPEAPPPPVYCR
jgi:hypothetical protein